MNTLKSAPLRYDRQNSNYLSGIYLFLGNHHQVRVAYVVLDEPSAHDDHAGVGGAHGHGIQLAEVALKFTGEIMLISHTVFYFELGVDSGLVPSPKARK